MWFKKVKSYSREWNLLCPKCEYRNMDMRPRYLKKEDKLLFSCFHCGYDWQEPPLDAENTASLKKWEDFKKCFPSDYRYIVMSGYARYRG